jgi:capsular polysaccharide biosynthesis protein
MENPQDPKLHFLDNRRVIRVRLGLVILVFLLVVIAAGVTTYLLPRKYKSFATIEVEPDMAPVRIFDNQAPRQQTLNDPKFTQTQFQIIMRKGVLYPVIERLDLRRKWGSNGEPLPKEAANARLLGMLSLQELRNTNLIQIHVCSTDPQEAAILANTIAEVYMEQRISEQQELVAKGLDQMRDDAKKQEEALSEAYVEASRLRTAANLSSGSWSSAQNLPLTGPAPINSVNPAAPVGEGIFTNLPFKTSLSADVGYDDNVFTSHTDRIGSGYNDLSLDIGSHVANQRSRLEGDLTLGFAYYWNRPGRSVDPNISLNLISSHQFTPRLMLDLSSSLAFQAQPTFAIAGAPTKNVGEYFFSSSQIALGYAWSHRFSTVTSYNLSTYFYDNSTEAAQQNRLEHLISQQLRYMLFPTVTGVTEYRFGYISYQTANTDSYSHFLLAGADATLSPRLSATFRGGAEFRTNLQPGGNQTVFPYIESTLVYEYRPSSFLQWYNRLGLEQPAIGTVQNGQSTKVYRTGIRLDHTLGRKMKIGAAVYYSYSEYQQPFSFAQNAIDANATTSYQIYRSLSLQAGYTFSRVFSKIASQDYYRNRISLGASFAF